MNTTPKNVPQKNTTQKLLAAFGLAVTFALSAFGASPASAQTPRFVRHDQLRQATHKDREAARAAAYGNYRKAARLRRAATRERRAAHLGY